MTDTENRIRQTAEKWLAGGEVNRFIGFRRRSDGTAVPALITSPEQAGSLVFGSGCLHNLTVFLNPEDEGVTGILLKGCDGRALVQLLAEEQMERSSVKVLGVVCPGLEDEGGNAEKCDTCKANTPPVYDELIEDGGTEQWDREVDDPELERVSAMSREERLEYFKEQFSRCIRCYACRDVCSLCYCRECVVEKTVPQWVEETVKPSSNTYWNLIRAYHLAGRCVDCGECDRACPVDIPLRILNRKMAETVEELFGFTPGMDPETTPAMLDFREDEEEVLCEGSGS